MKLIDDDKYDDDGVDDDDGPDESNISTCRSYILYNNRRSLFVNSELCT
jgi:hypothetical protein